jgi:protein polybromo-1
MAKDVDLLAKNAKTYNEPGSQVFKVYLSSYMA